MQKKGFFYFPSDFTNHFYVDKKQIEKWTKYCTGVAGEKYKGEFTRKDVQSYCNIKR